jgi:hypothetical protein
MHHEADARLLAGALALAVDALGGEQRSGDAGQRRQVNRAARLNRGDRNMLRLPLGAFGFGAALCAAQMMGEGKHTAAGGAPGWLNGE